MELISIDIDRHDREYAHLLCRNLERGDILLLMPTPFLPQSADADFLRVQRQAARAAHKNIAYKPRQRRVTGVQTQSEADAARLQKILTAYSEQAVAYLSALLPDYARSWYVDYASFRPVEEQGRNLPQRHRNDLLHLDAFPTRPTHGARILRAFTNLHPTRDRVWATAEPFEDLACRYAFPAGLKRMTGGWETTRRRLSKALRLAGIRVPQRSAYDEFMLRFHHYLKNNDEFQRTGRRHEFAFPPGATWISFTDQVAHAVVSGQYALEQTCIVPLTAMAEPQQSPVAVLGRLAGRPLTEENVSFARD